MEIETKKVWLIMSKCRKYVAKGTKGNRALIEVNNKKDKKRFLTYFSKGMAEAAFNYSVFSTYGLKDFPYRGLNATEYLEAVECDLNLIIKS